MLKPMAERPIIFALANPDPEISYPDAIAARPDALVATGRSRLPEPGQQRPRASRTSSAARSTAARAQVSEEMKLAAARALAAAHPRAGPRLRDRWRTAASPSRWAPTTSSPSRSIRACCGGSRPRSRRRRWTAGVARIKFDIARVPRAPDVEGLERGVLDHAHDRARGAPATQADRVPARREPTPAARVPADRRRGHRAADPARAPATRSKRCAPRCRSTCCRAASRSSIRGPTHDHGVRRAAVRAAPAQGHDLVRGAGAAPEERLLRRDHGRPRRRRRLVTGLRLNYPDTVKPMLEIFGLQPDVKVAVGMYMMVHPEPGEVLRRHRVQHRSRRRDARRHRRPDGRRGAELRRHAARRR